MSYIEKLKNPLWQKKRLEILNRDNFECKKCWDAENTLHVHHLSYQWGKDPWDYEESNFVTLCESCHKEETLSYKDENKNLINVLSKLGFLSENLRELSTALQSYMDGDKGYDKRKLWDLCNIMNDKEAIHIALDFQRAKRINGFEKRGNK